MRQNLNSEFLADLSPEEEEEMRQHVREILGEADGPLDMEEIYEKYLYRTTKQEVDSMIQDGLMVGLEGERYALSPRGRALQLRRRSLRQAGIRPSP